MGKVGKKYAKAREVAKAKPQYALQEAVATVTKAAFAKFDETVELAMRLGVDPKHADQMVRGTVILPHGLGGKAKRVLVIASGEKLKEGQDSGADFVGWCKEAGFTDFKVIPLAGPSSAAVAYK